MKKTKYQDANIFFFCLLSYLLMRLFIYFFFVVDDASTWLARDTVMDAPRIIIGVLALKYCLEAFEKEKIGLHLKQGRMALFILVLSLTMIILMGHFIPPTHGLESWQLVLVGVNSIFVAFYEEVVFRGLGLAALEPHTKSPMKNVVINSALFMVWHIGAQPIGAFPFLLAAGLIFGTYRIRGGSLIWCFAIHTIYDATTMVVMGDANFLYLFVQAAITMCIWLLVLRLQNRYVFDKKY